MPQAANIVLADNAVTPVNHTFVPNGKDANGVYWYVDRSQSNQVGYWKISVELKEPSMPTAGTSSKDRNYRVKIGLHEPVLESISNSSVSGILTAPIVAYIPRSVTEYIFSERTTLLDRQHIRKMTPLLLQQAQMVSVIDNLERIFG